jgi:hypothetical protein
MRRFGLTMSMSRVVALVATLVAAPLVAAPLAAQAWQGGRGNDDVPAGHRPPPGMCRIWIDGVPPGQQPAPTDCASAVRNRPANGRVIFGDDAGKGGKGKPKKFKGVGYAGDDDIRYSDDRRRTSDGAGRADDFADLRRTPRSDAPAGDIGAGRSLPDMMAGVLAQQGRRTDDVGRWLGGSQATPRLSDLDGNGVPERVMWFDAAGQLVQVWTDRNRDGRADRVELFENGRRVQVVGQ